MLTDTSALVALISSNDQSHKEAIKALQNIGADIIITTFPCFTEASLILDGRNPRRADLRIYDQYANSAIQLHYPTP